MKRLLAGFILSAAALALSGCYVTPGYSYVRHTSYQGDAYYGQGVRTYDDGYYAAPIYGGYYYSGGYGCCYAPGLSVGISSGWYGGSRYQRDRRGYRDYGYRNRRDGTGRRNSNDGRGHDGRRDSGRRSGSERSQRGSRNDH